LKKARPLQVIAGCAAIGALGSFATHSILPALSAIRTSLGSDIGITQLIVSLSLLSLGAGQLVVAPLSDRIGRRPIILTGLLLYVLASMAAAGARRIEWLIALRTLQAFGCGASISVARATIVDYFGPRHSASGIAHMATVILLVPMIAPTLGGYLAEFLGWRWIFVACALIGAGVLLYTWMRIGETHPPVGRNTSRRGVAHSYAVLMRSPDYLAYVCFGSFMTSLVYTVITCAPYIVIELMHVTPSTYGRMYLMPALGSFIGFFLAARTSRRLGALRMLHLGAVIGVVGALVLTVLLLLRIWHPLVIFLPATALGFANALSTPSSTSSAINTHPQIAGAASGALGFTSLALSAFTTQLTAHLVDNSPIPFAWMVLVQALVAMGVLWLLQRRHLHPTPSPDYDGSETITL